MIRKPPLPFRLGPPKPQRPLTAKDLDRLKVTTDQAPGHVGVRLSVTFPADVVPIVKPPTPDPE